MSAGEVAIRVRDEARHRLWQKRQVHPGVRGSGTGTETETAGAPPSRFPLRVPRDLAAAVPAAAREALVAAADQLIEGHWEILGANRDDMAAPDWFLDPVSGRRAPDDRYCFGVNQRSVEETGNVKQVWEVSRHQHLTVLAAAWNLTGDEKYAAVVDRQLRDWWQHNPFLSGVHWTSGIELGLRLIAWVWIRRLLADWEGAAQLFEANPEARRQIAWHQEYLATFRSRGSSANNHVIAEAAGQLVASCAFDWFPESEKWRIGAAALLERELEANTFPSGINRELASAYHGFVAELGLVAAIEAEASGHPLREPTWNRLCRMFDVAAAIADEQLRPPRQGDDDGGRVLLVDAPAENPWPSLLAAGAAVFGALAWWPEVAGDVRSTFLGAFAASALAGARSGGGGGPGAAPIGARPAAGGRPLRRPSHFADAGLTILRSSATGREIWCRCDAGPHGFLGIAAHAHADALSIELRCGGVDVFADPGTFCYHGDPQWRTFFRSTLGHNTLELAGQDQSESGGPFLWVRHASTRLTQVEVDGDDQRWSGEHGGYSRLEPPAVHRRSVHLDGVGATLEIVDRVDGTEGVEGGTWDARLAFHLGPTVEVVALSVGTGMLSHEVVARLAWPSERGPASASVHLPPELQWTAHRGETEPLLGWYSAGFGRKEPTTTLVGTGRIAADRGDLVTLVEFEL